MSLASFMLIFRLGVPRNVGAVFVVCLRVTCTHVPMGDGVVFVVVVVTGLSLCPEWQLGPNLSIRGNKQVRDAMRLLSGTSASAEPCMETRNGL